MYIENIDIERIMSSYYSSPYHAIINYNTAKFQPYNDISNPTVTQFQSSYKIDISAYLEESDMPYINDLAGKQISLRDSFKSFKPNIVPDNIMPDKKGIDAILNREIKQKTSMGYLRL